MWQGVFGLFLTLPSREFKAQQTANYVKEQIKLQDIENKLQNYNHLFFKSLLKYNL